MEILLCKAGARFRHTKVPFLGTDDHLRNSKAHLSHTETYLCHWEIYFPCPEERLRHWEAHFPHWEARLPTLFSLRRTSCVLFSLSIVHSVLYLSQSH